MHESFFNKIDEKVQESVWPAYHWWKSQACVFMQQLQFNNILKQACVCLVWVLMLTGLIKVLCRYVSMFLTSAKAREAFTLQMNLHVVLQLKPGKECRTRSSPCLPAPVISPLKELPQSSISFFHSGPVFLSVTLSIIMQCVCKLCLDLQQLMLSLWLPWKWGPDKIFSQKACETS